jgi:hypothetical protein
LTKLPWAEPELLFEGLAEGGMGIVTRGKRHLGDIHSTHTQLAARPAVLRQCHTGNSNAGRDVIEGLTKSAPVLGSYDG